jgi:hypothetical protein
MSEGINDATTVREKLSVARMDITSIPVSSWEHIIGTCVNLFGDNADTA